jgi:transcriptional regulator with XRE-family HTH domain
MLIGTARSANYTSVVTSRSQLSLAYDQVRRNLNVLIGVRHTANMDEHISDSRRRGAEAAAWQERVFGQNLRQRREELGISQRDLAERMQKWGHNWHQGTVRRVEAGERPARVGELMTLAGILEVGLIDLLITEREAKADAVQQDIDALLSAIRTIRRRSKEAQVNVARASEMRAIAEAQEARARDELEKARAMAAEAERSKEYALSQLAEHSATLDLLQSKLSRLEAFWKSDKVETKKK